MKKLILSFTLIAGLVVASLAQRFVYVDTDYILDNVPEYGQAQQQINQIAENWRQEIDAKYKEVEGLYKAYQAEQVLLPEQTKIQRQKEIEEKERAAKEFQKKKFGYEGELFQKKQELIKPVQDKVFKEIEKIAKDKAYDFVLDKSSGVSMLFANPKYNISDVVIKALGYSPSKTSDK